MPGQIWSLVSSFCVAHSNSTHTHTLQIFSTKSKQRRERRASQAKRTNTSTTLPQYTVTPTTGEVQLPPNLEPRVYRLAIEIATLTINDRTAPPPEYEPYNLSPASVRASFQL
jgi:ribosomal protein L32